MKIYKFENFYLNVAQRRIAKDRNVFQIPSRTFDVLEFLVRNHGKVVSKDELLGNVWNGSFVEEGNVAVHISRIRKSLGASKLQPIIESVSGVGYQFVGRVKEISDDEWEENISGSRTTSNKSSKTTATFSSIAVLPLHNENGDEEVDYLADGLTENIINNLSYIPGLKVLGRNTVFHYKDKVVSIREIGEKFDVETVMTGRIRVIRGSLVIGVELTNVEDRRQIWGAQYNQPFENILELQETITQEVLENLKSQIVAKSKEFEFPQATVNAESYRLYLKGKYLVSKRSVGDVEKAINIFQQSISNDPTNAHSYIELAAAYRLYWSLEQISRETAIEQIYPLLEKAAAINPNIPELYVVIGVVNLFLQFDFHTAEENMKLALELNENCLAAHYRYAVLLAFWGRDSESLTQMREISRLDPISTRSYKNIGMLFYTMGQFENSVIKFQECIELERDDFETVLFLGIALAELGRFDDALMYLHKSLKLQFSPATVSMIGYTHALAGNVTDADIYLLKLIELSDIDFFDPLYIGAIYSALGRLDEAFAAIAAALELRCSDLVAIKRNPIWRKIRMDKRFDATIRKIGFPNC